MIDFFNAISAGNKALTLGAEGSINTSSIQLANVPFNDLYRYQMLITPDGKTLIGGMLRQDIGAPDQSKAAAVVYDPNGGSQFNVFGTERGEGDTHLSPSFVRYGSEIYGFQEVTHNGNLTVYKNTSDFLNYAVQETINGTFAYATAYVYNGEIYVFTRDSGTRFHKSNGGPLSFGSALRVFREQSVPAEVDRFYHTAPGQFYQGVDGKFYGIICYVSVTAPSWFSHFLWVTEDFNIFSNIEGTYSFNRTSTDGVNGTVMEANFRFAQSDPTENDSLGIPNSCVDSEGNFYCVVYNGATGNHDLIYYNGSWNQQATGISDISRQSQNNGCTQLAFLNGELYGLFRINPAGDNQNTGNKMYLYKTSDFVNWESLGDIFPSQSTVNQAHFAENLQDFNSFRSIIMGHNFLASTGNVGSVNNLDLFTREITL